MDGSVVAVAVAALAAGVAAVVAAAAMASAGAATGSDGGPLACCGRRRRWCGRERSGGGRWLISHEGVARWGSIVSEHFVGQCQQVLDARDNGRVVPPFDGVSVNNCGIISHQHSLSTGSGISSCKKCYTSYKGLALPKEHDDNSSCMNGGCFILTTTIVTCITLL